METNIRRCVGQSRRHCYFCLFRVCTKAYNLSSLWYLFTVPVLYITSILACSAQYACSLLLGYCSRWQPQALRHSKCSFYFWGRLFASPNLMHRSMPVLLLWHKLPLGRKDATGAMLSTSIGMMLIGEGIASFCNDAFALSLLVAVVETIETTVESLDHCGSLTADVQDHAIGGECPPFQGFLYCLTAMPKPQRYELSHLFFLLSFAVASDFYSCSCFHSSLRQSWTQFLLKLRWKVLAIPTYW